MIRYIIRRILYAVPILIGVILFTFVLFYRVSSPELIARRNMSVRNPTPKQIKRWIHERGYDKPAGELFKEHMMGMLLFRFGNSDKTKEPIIDRIKEGVGPSSEIAGMVVLTSLVAGLTLAMVVAYFRGTYVDTAGTLVCVALMSVVYVVYVMALQFLLGKLLHYGPLAGFQRGPESWRFVVLPVIIGVIAKLGTDVRLYRTFLLEEMNQDYVRTARAKGLREGVVLFKHVLKNAMIPVVTSTVSTIPLLILGSIILESFFAIPGLGTYLQDAIVGQDFAVVRAMVYLGTVLYIVGLIVTDVLYAALDPRLRFE